MIVAHISCISIAFPDSNIIRQFFIGKEITINMAPADIRKEGSAYDLTIAVGILTASGQIESKDVSNYVIMGELSLDGGLRGITGALPIAVKARDQGFKGIILPKQNAQEAAIVNDIVVVDLCLDISLLSISSPLESELKSLLSLNILESPVSKSPAAGLLTKATGMSKVFVVMLNIS